VIVLDFTAVMRGAGPYHPALVQAARGAAGVSPNTPTVLIAHSGAGALVPMIAAALGGDVGAIFVDALLPHPGQSWFDTASESLKQRLMSLAQEGRVPPWPQWWPKGAIEAMLGDPALYDAFAAECMALPLSYFAEVAPEAGEPKQCAYLQLSDGYATERASAAAKSWPTHTLPVHHLALITHADSVIGVLDEILRTFDSR
jgi:hypothetical protein